MNDYRDQMAARVTTEKNTRRRRLWWLFAAALAVSVLYAVWSEHELREGAKDIDPVRRDVIASETRCDLLQDDFDAADAGATNGPTSEFRRMERAVMNLAHDRMSELGCYG